MRHFNNGKDVLINRLMDICVSDRVVEILWKEDKQRQARRDVI